MDNNFIPNMLEIPKHGIKEGENSIQLSSLEINSITIFTTLTQEIVRACVCGGMISVYPSLPSFSPLCYVALKTIICTICSIL